MTLLLLLTACRPPEAPDTIEEMMVYGFTHYDDDPAYLIALADKLVPFMESHSEELGEGYEVNALTGEHLTAAGVENEGVDGVVGAAVGLYYNVSLDELAFGLTYPEQADIFETYLAYERLSETDRDCFLEDACETHFCENSVHAAFGAGIEMWNEFSQDSRWIVTEEGERFLVMQVLGPEPVEFSIDWLEVPQQYSFSFVYENDEGVARRVQSIWVEGHIVDADVPESFALNLGINNMLSSAEDLDLWLTAQR